MRRPRREKQRQVIRKEIEVTCKTEGQQEYLQAILEEDLIICSGPAGSGKSYIAMGAALKLVHENPDKYKRIIMARPYIVLDGEDMGFLPGDANEKLKPFMRPLLDNMRNFIDMGLMQTLLGQGAIEFIPVAHMRGLAQPLDAEIITPNGIKTMGDIKVGDFIIGKDGKKHRVFGVYDQGELDIYKVTFSDGTSTECCGNHLWNTKTRYEKKKEKRKTYGFTTKTTIQIMESLKHGRVLNHELPLTNPVLFEESELTIDPYLLGVILGDGTISGNAVWITSKDEELMKILKPILDDEGVEPKLNSDGITYRLSKIDSNIKTNSLVQKLRNLNLMGTDSYTKFIPKEYLLASPDDRLAILQGLLDTDGWCGFHKSGKNRVQFYSVNKALSDGVKWIVQSLGGVTHTIIKKPGRGGILANDHIIQSKMDLFQMDIVLPVGIVPFKLSRKKDKFIKTARPKRLIRSIELIGKKPARCIAVSAQDKLYLTNDFIVTHNTYNNCIVIFDEAQNARKEHMRMFLTRLGNNCKAIVEGDVTQSDLKGDDAEENGLSWAMSRLDDVEGVAVIEMLQEDIVRSDIVKRIIGKL